MSTHSRVFRAFSGVALVGFGALALAGCTPTEAKAPVNSTTTVYVTQTPSPSETATAGPSPEITESAIAYATLATVSFASVDVDGKSVSMGGFVTQVAEDGGACTFTLTNDQGEAVTQASTGIENVGTTSCGTVTVAMDRLHRGTWSATLTYQSSTTNATSDAVPVEVP